MVYDALCGRCHTAYSLRFEQLYDAESEGHFAHYVGGYARWRTPIDDVSRILVGQEVNPFWLTKGINCREVDVYYLSILPCSLQLCGLPCGRGMVGEVDEDGGLGVGMRVQGFRGRLWKIEVLKYFFQSFVNLIDKLLGFGGILID